MAIMLSSIPAFIMSFILIIPLEKTMALGGVEIGIIKAKLAARVTVKLNT